MTQNAAKLMPNLDEKSTKIFNLTVLQRIDPFIDEILITVAHVTLYKFNLDLHQWSRKDVEGSLFVVKRNAQPRFQFIVMNRRNTENLVEDLLGDFEYELQVPYLLYQNAAHEVNGIWFYNPCECEDVAKFFTSILGAYSRVSPKKKVNESEFEELEAEPNSAIIEGPLEPSFTASACTDIPEDFSFKNFFGTARNLGHHASSNSVNSIQPYHHNSTHVPLHSRVASSPTLNYSTNQIPTCSSFNPGIPRENPDLVDNCNHVTNLIKPLSFLTPSLSASSLMPQYVPSSVSVAPPNAQRSYGIPLLQPFPPPTPPPSLTLSSGSNLNNGQLRREKVRDALLMLAQDNQFIDMFHKALLKTHQQ